MAPHPAPFGFRSQQEQKRTLNRKFMIEENWDEVLEECIPKKIRPRKAIPGQSSKATVFQKHAPLQNDPRHWGPEFLRCLEELASLTRNQLPKAQKLCLEEVNARQNRHGPDASSRKWVAELEVADIERVIKRLRSEMASANKKRSTKAQQSKQVKEEAMKSDEDYSGLVKEEPVESDEESSKASVASSSFKAPKMANTARSGSYYSTTTQPGQLIRQSKPQSELSRAQDSPASQSKSQMDERLGLADRMLDVEDNIAEGQFLLGKNFQEQIASLGIPALDKGAEDTMVKARLKQHWIESMRTGLDLEKQKMRRD
ncbi:hypothetical protein H2201_003947 [Coniosporium apollinis]|uniref:Uncharacterized protein n=1 Tax=Coniosporium apollinis TaxID=61459 RepID=A0ABQ9NXK7_9PEZI|nr:hypothetical protein H2201_003947 [Coniosporium apollinis]